MKEARPHDKRNFTVFAANHILMRMGWIFKTESVVMPGFIDTYTASGFIRGLLPLISRIGQSIPQFLIAHRLAQMPRKQVLFTVSAFGVMIPWIGLAVILGLTRWSSGTIIAVFLAFYGLHWFTYGCNNIAGGTLQGKLIPADKRGRLLAYSHIIGCALAIAAVFFLMPRWLQEGNTQYAWIFGTTGVFFGLSACVSLYFKEPPSPPPREVTPFLKFLANGLLLVRYDRDFRRLAVVILLFYSSWPLFPHYTVFGKRTLGIVSRDFATLVIAQNTVSALGSWVMGNIADRRGNRIVLRTLIFINAAVPWLAIGISLLPDGGRFYWLVYACLGLTPVSNRILTNYTLEISPQEKHPQYLGVAGLLQLIPLCASPLLGSLIERFSFELVFIGCSVLVFVGGFLTFRLAEPRFASRPQAG